MDLKIQEISYNELFKEKQVYWFLLGMWGQNCTPMSPLHLSVQIYHCHKLTIT